MIPGRYQNAITGIARHAQDPGMTALRRVSLVFEG